MGDLPPPITELRWVVDCNGDRALEVFVDGVWMPVPEVAFIDAYVK